MEGKPGNIEFKPWDRRTRQTGEQVVTLTRADIRSWEPAEVFNGSEQVPATQFDLNDGRRIHTTDAKISKVARDLLGPARTDVAKPPAAPAATPPATPPSLAGENGRTGVPDTGRGPGVNPNRDPNGYR